MVVLTSIALIGMMFFIMARISDPLVPRAIFGVLNTLLFFPSGAVYPIAGFPEMAARAVGVRPVHLRRPRLPHAAAQGRRHRRDHHGYFRAGFDLGGGAGRRDAAVPADLVTMPRTAAKAAPRATPRLERRRSRIVVLQLEDLAGGAPASGSRPGAAGAALERVLAAGHRRRRQHFAA